MFLTLATLALFAQSPDTTIPVKRGQTLEINSRAGDVTIRAWAQNTVRIQLSDDDERARLQIEQSSTTVSVHASRRMGQPVDGDFEISVPTWMAVRLSGVNGSMRVEGTQAPVSIETVEGDIGVRGGAEFISLQTIQGAISLEDARGKIDLSSVNEDISARRVAGDVSAETVNGGLTLWDVESENVSASTVNGDILFLGGIRRNGRYHLSTHNGDLTIGIPETADAQVTVATFQGDFESDYPVTLQERHGKRFTFTLGSGSARVELESFQGTVALKRPATLQHDEQDKAKHKGKDHDKDKDKDDDR